MGFINLSAMRPSGRASKQSINLGINQLPYNTVLLVQATSLQKLSHGDISDVLATALSKAVSISAPVFFSNGGGPQSTLQDTSETWAHLAGTCSLLICALGTSASSIDLHSWCHCSSRHFSSVQNPRLNCHVP